MLVKLPLLSHCTLTARASLAWKDLPPPPPPQRPLPPLGLMQEPHPPTPVRWLEGVFCIFCYQDPFAPRQRAASVAGEGRLGLRTQFHGGGDK